MSFLSWLKSFFRPARELTQSGPPVRSSAPGAGTSGDLVPVPVPKGWEHLQIWSNGDGDLIVKGTATAFGGDADALDNGQTASGYPTKGHPNLLGVALPMHNVHVWNKDRGYVLAGSPIPAMPFGMRKDGHLNLQGAFVDVTFPDGSTVFKVPVIDLGPAGWTKKAIDLTVAVARKYSPHATANNFSCPITYRIRGGARYLPSNLIQTS